MIGRGAGRVHGIAALALGIAAILLYWPGVATYDGVAQYAQVLAGDYDDWHPPVMARLWALTNHAMRGAAPLMMLQMIGWWGGLGALAAALARIERPRWGWGVLALGAFPPMLGWLGVAVKDGQMLGAMTGAVGLIGWWRLRGARVPVAAWIGAGVLLGYAALVRANAPFAVVPLALALAEWPGGRSPWARAGLVLAGTGAVILIAGPINHRLLGATRSHVERTLPLYDLAGIAHRVPLATIPGLPPAVWRAAERRGCYGPLMWDAYGDDKRCGFVGSALAFGDGASSAIFGDWVRMIVRHPIAYAWHRIDHLDHGFRFVVHDAVPNAAAPAMTEPNALGLGTPGPAARWVQRVGAFVAASPLGWPIVWLGLAIVDAVVAFGAVATPPVRLARALIVSSLVLSASFAVVSIAPDLRYHLWSMTAAGLAALLLGAAGAVSRRQAAWGGAAMGIVALIGTIARLV